MCIVELGRLLCDEILLRERALSLKVNVNFHFRTFCAFFAFTKFVTLTFTYFVILVFSTFARFVLLLLCYSVVKVVDGHSDSRGSIPIVRPGPTIDFLEVRRFEPGW